MSIKDKYTDEEIEEFELIIQQLYAINEELNSRIIGFHAKLTNEEKKVKRMEEVLHSLGYEMEKVRVDSDGRVIRQGRVNDF